MKEKAIINIDGVDYTITKSDTKNDLLSKKWAIMRINDLNSLEDRQEILKLSRDYKIVTEQSSFIVIDSIDLYLKYDIQPKENSIFYKDYMEAKEKTDKEKKKEMLEHLKKIVNEWNELNKKLESYKNIDFNNPEIYTPKEKSIPIQYHEELTMSTSPSSPMQQPGRLYALRERRESSESRVMSKSLPNLSESANNPTIVLAEWKPDAPYVSEYVKNKDKDVTELMKIYRSQQTDKEYRENPSFYLDTARFFSGFVICIYL